jgi:hypothetical protein
LAHWDDAMGSGWISSSLWIFIHFPLCPPLPCGRRRAALGGHCPLPPVPPPHSPPSLRRRRNCRRAKPVWSGGGGSPRRFGGPWWRRPAPTSTGGVCRAAADRCRSARGRQWISRWWCYGLVIRSRPLPVGFPSRGAAPAPVGASGAQCYWCLNYSTRSPRLRPRAWWSGGDTLLRRRWSADEVWWIKITHLVPASSCGGGASENRALTTVMRQRCLSSTNLSYSGGNPRSWSTGSDDGDVLCRSPS